MDILTIRTTLHIMMTAVEDIAMTDIATMTVITIITSNSIMRTAGVVMGQVGAVGLMCNE